MHYEFAVDPESVGLDWNNFHLLIGSFGFEHGRLISEFPVNWRKEVLAHTSASSIRPIQKAKIVKQLELWTRNGTIINLDRPFDNNSMNWLENAILQNRNNPFRAIITDKELNDEINKPTNIIEISFMKTSELFKVRTAKSIPSVGKNIAEAMGMILRYAKKVCFVDPYFDLNEMEFLNTFEQCLNLVQTQKKGTVECEIHYSFDQLGKGSKQVMEEIHSNNRLNKLLTDYFQNNWSLKIYCWKNQEGKPGFHDRFLLTNVGSMTLGKGFRALGPRDKVNIGIVTDVDFHEELLQDYFSEPSEFYELEGCLKVSSDGFNLTVSILI